MTLMPEMKKRIQILLLVAAVAALAFAVSSVRIYRPNAPKSVVPQTIQALTASIKMAVDQYKLDCGAYPAPAAGLRSLVANPRVARWNGPYLKRLPTDPWGQDFRYSLDDGKPEIRSAGPDMKFGTPDDFTSP